jgi:MFS family permease
MVVSIFVLAFAVSPLVFGPLSELCGRVRVLQYAGLFYAIFNLVCAFATTPGQFMAFRFLAGWGGGAPLSIGAGVLSDMWRAEERGKASALYSLGPLLGPAMGYVSLSSFPFFPPKLASIEAVLTLPHRQTGHGWLDCAEGACRRLQNHFLLNDRRACFPVFLSLFKD